MSNVIQSIIYPLTPDRADKVDCFIAKIPDSQRRTIDEHRKFKTIGIILSNLANGRVFNDDFNELSLEISSLTHQALLVLYDDRIGYRYSCAFGDGKSIEEFSSDRDGDEVWVLVDDDCNPLLDRQFLVSQVNADLNEDNEYMTLHNALDRGLGTIGLREQWQEIKELCY